MMGNYHLIKMEASRKERSQFGFTLLEMLVVFFVISILTVVMLADYRSGQKKYALQETTQKLTSDLRQAQHRAMSGIDIKDQYCGYGIEINTSARPTSYRIYADIAADCKNTNRKYDGSDDIIEEVNFTNRIRFQSTNPDPIDIFFKPPNPNAYINQSDAPGLFGVITLEVEGTSMTETVNLNTYGLIQSSYGGGSPPLGFCQGTPTACSSFGDQSSCENQTGCSWQQGGCDGACTACGSLGWFACFFQSGCNWNWPFGPCQGTCTPCSSYGDQGSCQGQSGCYWDPSSCSGTAALCEDYTTEGGCTSQGGCSWITP